MKTFATMLAMTALATGIQITAEYDYAQADNAVALPNPNLTPEQVAKAMIEFNGQSGIGGTTVQYCQDSESWRTCPSGTKNGCDMDKVCAKSTGYGTAVYCVESDGDVSIKLCQAGTRDCSNNDEKLCKPEPPKPKRMGGPITIKCDKWRGGDETRECHAGAEGCTDNGAPCSALQIQPQKINCPKRTDPWGLCEFDMLNKCKDESLTICP